MNVFHLISRLQTTLAKINSGGIYAILNQSSGSLGLRLIRTLGPEIFVPAAARPQTPKPPDAGALNARCAS